jgi:hypothetical protein
VLKPLKPLFLAALLCAAASSQAAITVYTSQAAFLSATSNQGTDSYDDLTVDLYDETLHRTAGSYTYDAYASGGLYGAGAPGDYWLSTNLRGSPIVFGNFSAGVNAFGGNFFGSDITGAFFPGGNLVLTADDGSTLNYALNGTTTATFLGFVSDSALSSVSLTNDGGLNWPTANNVVLAAAVPEPATYGMLLAGLGFVGAMAGRRRR